MKKIIIAILFVPFLGLAADNFLEFGDVNFGRDFKEKSKWIFKLGSETIHYVSKFPEYKGEHVTVESEEADNVNGYGLSLGRDFYLGGGVSTSFQISGLYSKTLDKVTGKAAKDINIDFSEVRTAHQMTAYEASFALNYLFDYKVVDIQPFIEFGAGAGEVLNQKEYHRRGFPSETEGSEEYNVSVKEKFALTRLSIGINFISYKGLMSYIKVSSVPIFITKRETDGRTNLKGTAVYQDVSSKDSSLNEKQNLTMISIGIGSYF